MRKVARESRPPSTPARTGRPIKLGLWCSSDRVLSTPRHDGAHLHQFGEPCRAGAGPVLEYRLRLGSVRCRRKGFSEAGERNLTGAGPRPLLDVDLFFAG
jgi:hypothetical protein